MQFKYIKAYKHGYNTQSPKSRDLTSLPFITCALSTRAARASHFHDTELCVSAPHLHTPTHINTIHVS